MKFLLRNHNNDGFTLVELLITLILMAIIVECLAYGTTFIFREIARSNNTLGAVAVLGCSVDHLKATGNIPDQGDSDGYIVSKSDNGIIIGNLHSYTITVQKRLATNPSLPDPEFTPIKCSFYWSI